MSRFGNPYARPPGVELAELPGVEVYQEPAFDAPTDDGAPALPVDPAADSDHELDFEAAWSFADLPEPERPDTGHSAAEHLLIDEFDYVGWTCDCKATAKTGIPPRHYLQYRPEYVWAQGPHYLIMIGSKEIKQAKGGEQVADEDDEDAGRADPIECPTWRRAVRTWTRRRRDWSKVLKHAPAAPAPAPEPVAPPVHPKGPLAPPEALEPATAGRLMPARSTAKGLCVYAATVHTVSGRMLDDGEVVTRWRLAGTLPSGGRWVAEWTEGRFAMARVNGSLVNLTELRKMLKDETMPAPL